MSPPRSLLLVGEGNFSFSASTSQMFSGTDARVTATCLQQQEDALKFEGAAENIQVVEDHGGRVIFGVDCTQLQECSSLKGLLFDRILFNFPHCGRKSGVKKNRELLRNFFLSCVQLLAEGGEVHVALCNGQGGTPADEPQRERHNSWQLVAMAAEADLVLSDVQPFQGGKHQSYKCTGYRSQDKGFHVDKALLHVLTRSAPYVQSQLVKMEEVVGEEKVQYNVPAELHEYLFREFLSSGSVHPVKLVQNYLLQGLEQNWSVSMMTENVPVLLTARQLLRCREAVDSSDCYWIHPLQKDVSGDTVSFTQAVDKSSVSSRDEDPEGEGRFYLLRPSLRPQVEEILNKKESLTQNEPRESGRGGEEEQRAVCNGVTPPLYGLSDVVFRRVPISPWAAPAFHQLFLTGVLSAECEPVRQLGETLEPLLAPYGVSLVPEEGGVQLVAQPVGAVGKVSQSRTGERSSDSAVTVSLNLDLLAVLLFSLPDWRLLWSRDQRFLRQFGPDSAPGTSYRPFSLFPEHFRFDICFWTGPSWEEEKFHALVREAGRGTVEQVKLLDTFSHPDLSQTSYCYRLVYHTHTHALSHTQALLFHKRLETLLSSQLQVTVR